MHLFFRLILIAGILFIGSCAPLPDTGIDPTYDFSSIRTIGIYIDPSDKRSHDTQLYNLLSMNFISLGYRVVDLNPAVSSGTPSGSPSFKGFRQTALAVLNDTTSACDAVVVIRSTWKQIARKTSESFYYTRGVFLDEVNLEMAVFGLPTLRAAISRNITFTQNIITDERSSGMILEPVRYLLQRTLTEAVKDFPVCTVDQSRPSLFKIPVAVYVDEAYRNYYGKQWNIQLSRRILYANDILKRYFDMELAVENYYSWSPLMNTNTQSALLDLIQRTPDAQNKLILGFIKNNTLQYNWHERNDIGIAEYFGNHLVICDLPSFPGLESWDALEEAITIIHETGHIFGAMHTMENASIMFPQTGSSSYRFDSLNSAVIMRSCAGFQQDSRTIRSERGLSILKDVYSRSRTGKSLFIHSFFSLIQQDRIRSMGKSGKLPSKDTLNTDLTRYTDDRALRLALEGYFHFQAKRWKDAESFFLRSEELDPLNGEIDYYLAVLYGQLEDKENMRKYLKLAEKNLFGTDDE